MDEESVIVEVRDEVEVGMWFGNGVFLNVFVGLDVKMLLRFNGWNVWLGLWLIYFRDLFLHVSNVLLFCNFYLSIL